MNKTGNRPSLVWYYLALVFGIWFLLTGALWVYALNVIVSFPFGLISFIIWTTNRKSPGQEKKYQILGWILFVGLSLSSLVLSLFMLF